MKKGGREFFEAFRRVPEKEKTGTWWLKKPEPAASTEEEEVAAKAPPPPEPAASPARDGGARPNRVNLSLSRELLVVASVALAGILVGAYVWGYNRGISKSWPAAESPVPAATRPSAVAAQDPTPAKPPYYTLRVMDGINLQRAREVMADLRAMGFDAFVLQAHGLCSVNVGRYASYQTAEARTFKDKVNSLVYRNRQWFTSCSWQRVTGQGSIER